MPATVQIIYKATAQTSEATTQVTSDLTSIVEGASSGGIAIATFFGDFAAHLTEVALHEGWHLIQEGFQSIVEGGIASNAQFETFTNQFSILLGSMDQAKDRMKELQDVGLKSPFELKDITAADLSMTNFGLDSESTAQRFGKSGADIRTALIDAAAGVSASSEEAGAKLQSITDAVGKFSQTGSKSYINALIKMKTTTLSALTAAGIKFDAHGHAIGDITENTGKLIEALGEKYKGSADIAMTSLSGLMSNAADMKSFIERTLTSSLFDGVRAALASLLNELNKPEVKQAWEDMNAAIGKIMVAFGNLFGSADDNVSKIPAILGGVADMMNNVADGAVAASEEIGNVWKILGGLFDEVKGLLGEVKTDGSNLITSFAQGMMDGMGAVESALGGMGNYITGMLRANSPPKLIPDLDKYGLAASKSYFDAWGDPEAFKMFDSIKGTVKDLIDGLVATGQVGKAGAIPMIMGTDRDIASIITQIKDGKDLTSEMISKITQDAGPAAGGIVAILRANIDLSVAMKAVATDQQNIKTITDTYNDTIAKLKTSLQDVQTQLKANKDATQDALQPFQDDLDKVNASLADMRMKAADAIAPFQDDLDSVNSKLDDLKSKAAEAMQPFQDQNSLIDGELHMIDLKKQEVDLQDQIAGKGTHQFDLQKAQNTVAQDAVKAKIDENSYNAQHEVLLANINGGKLKGAQLDAEKLRLQDLELSRTQQIADLQLKTAEDQQKLQNITSGGNIDQANLKLQKVQNEERITDIQNKAKPEETQLNQQAAKDKSAIRDIQNDAAPAERAAQRQATHDQAHITAINTAAKVRDQVLNEEAAKIQANITAETSARDAALAVAKDQLTQDQTKEKTAKDHLTVLQDQTKEMKDQLALATAQNAILNPKGKSGGGGPIFQDTKDTTPVVHSHPGQTAQEMRGLANSNDRTDTNPINNIKKEIEGFVAEVKDKVATVQGFIKGVGDAFTQLTAPISTAKGTWDSFQPTLVGVGSNLSQIGGVVGDLATKAFPTLGADTQNITQEFNKFWPPIQNALLPALKETTRLIGDVAPIAFGALALWMTPIIGIINGLVSGFNAALPSAMIAVQSGIATVTDAFKAVSDTIEGFSKFFTDLVNGNIKGAWDDLLGMSQKVTDDINQFWKDMFGTIGNTVTAGVLFILGYVEGFVGGVLNWFGTLADKLVGHSIVPDMMTAIQNSFTGMITTVTTAVGGWVGDVLKGFQGLSDDIIGPQGAITNLVTKVETGAGRIGDGLVGGIKAGINSAWGGFIDHWNYLVDQIPLGAGKALEIHSPSQLMSRLFENVPLGAIDGVLKHKDALKDTIKNMWGGSDASQALIDTSKTTLALGDDKLSMLKGHTNELQTQLDLINKQNAAFTQTPGITAPAGFNPAASVGAGSGTPAAPTTTVGSISNTYNIYITVAPGTDGNAIGTQIYQGIQQAGKPDSYAAQSALTLRG